MHSLKMHMCVKLEVSNRDLSKFVDNFDSKNKYDGKMKNTWEIVKIIDVYIHSKNMYTYV